MAAHDTTASPPSDLPTEDAPDYGTLGWLGVEISEVAHWIEDGDHVFRSLEFDVFAGDPDEQQAVGKFVDNALDFRDYLDCLEDRADNEDEMLQLLNSRFSRVASALDREERARQDKRVSITIGRRRRRHRADLSRFWHPRSTPQRSSSQPSRA